jgi:catechol 2,3-dioxygenase-like lactoylglutathione lyase family enzyme
MNTAEPLMALGLPVGDRKAKNFQLGFVVEDLEAALDYWTQIVGVGPFVVMRVGTQGRRVVHRGQDIALTLDLAIAYMGDVQIELIRQICDTPSPFTEFLSRGNRGLHHIAFWLEDFTQDLGHLAACGFTEAMAFYGPDNARGVTFLEAPDAIGTMVELVPGSPEKAAYFERMRNLGRDWDGTSPAVMHFASMTEFMASGQGAGR